MGCVPKAPFLLDPFTIANVLGSGLYLHLDAIIASIHATGCPFYYSFDRGLHPPSASFRLLAGGR